MSAMPISVQWQIWTRLSPIATSSVLLATTSLSKKPKLSTKKLHPSLLPISNPKPNPNHRNHKKVKTKPVIKQDHKYLSPLLNLIVSQPAFSTSLPKWFTTTPWFRGLSLQRVGGRRPSLIPLATIGFEPDQIAIRLKAINKLVVICPTPGRNQATMHSTLTYCLGQAFSQTFYVLWASPSTTIQTTLYKQVYHKNSSTTCLQKQVTLAKRMFVRSASTSAVNKTKVVSCPHVNMSSTGDALARGSDTIRPVPYAGLELGRSSKILEKKSKAKLSSHQKQDRTETVAVTMKFLVQGP